MLSTMPGQHTLDQKVFDQLSACRQVLLLLLLQSPMRIVTEVMVMMMLMMEVLSAFWCRWHTERRTQ